MILPFCEKSKDIFSQRNTLKDGISGITEKDDIHPTKYGISSNRKIKDDKKFCFYEKVPMILWTFIETFIDVFIYCLSIKEKNRKFNILDWN